MTSDPTQIRLTVNRVYRISDNSRRVLGRLGIENVDFLVERHPEMLLEYREVGKDEHGLFRSGPFLSLYPKDLQRAGYEKIPGTVIAETKDARVLPKDVVEARAS